MWMFVTVSRRGMQGLKEEEKEEVDSLVVVLAVLKTRQSGSERATVEIAYLSSRIYVQGKRKTRACYSQFITNGNCLHPAKSIAI